MIKSERQAHDYVLLLDAGDSILGGWEEDYGAKARMMVEAMNRLGYDALTVGEGELRLGANGLLEVMTQANFPFLSANLTQGKGGPLLVRPYTLLKLGGHRIAIIGVTSPKDTDIHQLGKDEVGVLDPIESVRQQVAALKNRAEVIIVLSHLGVKMDKELAHQVEGIDLIVGGRSGRNLEKPLQDDVTGTVIVQAGIRGEWLGITDLELDGQGHIVSYKGRNRELSEDIAEDPEMSAWLQSMQPTPTPRSRTK